MICANGETGEARAIMASRLYTRAEIRENVASKRDWAEKGLVAIANDGGFSLLDGALSDMAEQLRTGQRQHLSDKQLAVVQKALSQYYVDRLERLQERRARIRMCSEAALFSTVGEQ